MVPLKTHDGRDMEVSVLYPSRVTHSTGWTYTGITPGKKYCACARVCVHAHIQSKPKLKRNYHQIVQRKKNAEIEEKGGTCYNKGLKISFLLLVPPQHEKVRKNHSEYKLLAIPRQAIQVNLLLVVVHVPKFLSAEHLQR